MMIHGITMSIGGKEWTIPPLTLGQLRRLMPKVRQLSALDEKIGETQISVIVAIVAAALQRNYPDINEEVVEDLLDLGNAASVLTAVLTGSGLKPGVRPPGEAIAPGHGSGATAPTTMTTAGETSTGSSQQPADTATRSSTQ